MSSGTFLAIKGCWGRVMDKAKAKVLREELARCLANCEVEYDFSDGLHKFSINCDRPNRLYVYSDFLSLHTKDELIDALHGFGIPEMFRTSSRSRWLALGKYGVRDVILSEV